MDGYSLNAVISRCRMQPQLFWCSFLVSQMFDMPLGSPFTDTWLMAIAYVGSYLLTVFQELSSECHSCLCNISQRCWSDWHFWSQVLPLGSSSGVLLGMLFQPLWGRVQILTLVLGSLYPSAWNLSLFSTVGSGSNHFSTSQNTKHIPHMKFKA